MPGNPEWSIPVLKITPVTYANTTHVVVSGRIGAEQLPELRRFVETEPVREVVVDLTEVTIVDVDVVRFLSECEAQGIQLLGCPRYVREWIAREK